MALSQVKSQRNQKTKEGNDILKMGRLQRRRYPLFSDPQRLFFVVLEISKCRTRFGMR